MYKAYKEARLLNYQICGRHIFTHKHTPFIFSRQALHQVLWKRVGKKGWTKTLGTRSGYDFQGYGVLGFWSFRPMRFRVLEFRFLRFGIFFPGYSNNTGPMLGIEHVEGYAGSAMGKRLVCGEHVLRGNMTRSKQFVANNQAFSFAHHEPFQFRYFYKMSVHKTITSSPRNNRGLPRLYYELMEFMAVH